MSNLIVGIPDGMHADAIKYLETQGIGIIPQKESKDMGIERLLQEADAIAARSETTVKKLPENTRTKILGRAGSGVDNFLPAWEQINAAYIPIVNAPDPNARSVSQLVFAYIKHDAMDLAPFFEASRRGEWTKGSFKGRLLDGCTIGIIGGAGRIGRAVTAKANSYGMKVLAQDIHPGESNANVKFVDLDRLLKESDYVSVHASFAGEPLITARELAMMKPGAVLINAARGGIVDESALVQALKEGRIKRAYVDVFTSEPFNDPKKNPSQALQDLLNLKNAFCTPHIAASTPEGQRQTSLDTAKKLANYLQYGFLEDACNMNIDPGLGYLRGTFHRLGMLTKQYAGGDVKSVKILLDGELMTIGDKVRTQLEESYLCGLLSNGNYVNPLNVKNTASSFEHSITNVDERKSDVAQVKIEGSGSKYVLEADYKKGELVGVGYTGSDGSFRYYNVQVGLDGNIAVFEHDNKAGAIRGLTGPIAEAKINIQTLCSSEDGVRSLTVARLARPLQNIGNILKQPIDGINFYQANSLILPPKGAF